MPSHMALCPNAPGDTKKTADDHTLYGGNPGNAAGVRWFSHYALTGTCEKCGCRLVGYRTWKNKRDGTPVFAST